MLNSLQVTVLITLGQLVTCSMAAYAFARLRFPGRDTLFLVFLSQLMVPQQVTIIPVFILIRVFGLLDTPWALIVPALFSAFGTFLLRQFFLTIPNELEDAARVDGAGYVRTFVQIILPLAGPALATLTIFTFNFYWNEFFRPLLFISTWERMTLPLGLTIMKGFLGVGNVAAIMAGVSMGILPVLVVFLLGPAVPDRGRHPDGDEGMTGRGPGSCGTIQTRRHRPPPLGATIAVRLWQSLPGLLGANVVFLAWCVPFGLFALVGLRRSPWRSRR